MTDAEVHAFAKATKALLEPKLFDAIQNHPINFENSLRYMSVAARLEDARTSRGLTLKDAARELGAPKYRLEDVEKGHLNNLNPGLLGLYVEYLGLRAWFSKWKKANPNLSERLGLTSNAVGTPGVKPASLPVLVKILVEKKIDAFLKKRLPSWAAAEVRLSYTFRGNTATIFEHRAPWREGDTEWTGMSVAQLRYVGTSGKWALYCADRNSRWHEYTNVAPAKDIDSLLDEIERDPTHIFWG